MFACCVLQRLLTCPLDNPHPTPTNTQVFNDKPSSVNEIKKELEGSDNSLKVEAMKKVINLMLAGEPLGQLFIPIVRYVLPSDDHALQKLLLLYMETISMTDAKGKLLPEMILICQNLRNNLQHPNE